MGVAGKQREEEDRSQAVRYFTLLGWQGDSEEDQISDSRLSALLARARAYKKELEGWKEKNRCVCGIFVCGLGSQQ